MAIPGLSDDAFDRIKALQPGRGHLDLVVHARPEFVGARLDLQARLDESWSAFAEAWAGWEPASGRESLGARAGVRLEW
ncbi:MAG: hypothetical protein AAFU79_02040 [Myxococcota bacterium]